MAKFSPCRNNPRWDNAGVIADLYASHASGGKQGILHVSPDRRVGNALSMHKQSAMACGTGSQTRNAAARGLIVDIKPCCSTAYPPPPVRKHRLV